MKGYLTDMEHPEVLGLVALLALPLALTEYGVFLATTYLLFAVLALSVDLLWGYAGMLSIGHAAFFGAGAYASGLLLRDYPQAPDLVAVFVIVPIAIGLAALVLGYLFFKSDLTGGAFAIMTLIIAVATERITSQFAGIFGGIGGFGGIPDLTLFGAYALSDIEMYYLTVVVLAGTYAGLKWLVRSPFGSVLQSIRENKERTEFLGFNTARYRLAVFTLSAMVAALAGAVYTPATGFISPSVTGLLLSTTAVIWVAVGGKGTLLGAVVGSLVLQLIETFVSEAFPSTWQIVLALLFILVILKAPSGIVGLIQQWRAGGSTMPSVRTRLTGSREASDD
jgi:urea ABC transporter permease protein UrtC